MFRGPEEIRRVVAQLEARDASLWHACQLLEFGAYLAVGGMPSRSLLEQVGLRYTSFQTDSSDRSRGVWSKVFLNMSDFGEAFAYGAAAAPNPYGPIVFQIRPATLSRASDVAITLRSAGAAGFDRERESLAAVEDVDRLYLHPRSDPFPRRTRMRFRDSLRAEFSGRYPDAVNAEMSVTVEPELVPLEDVIAIWVDPLGISERRLVDAVKDAVAQSPWSGPVRERGMTAERRLVMDEVVQYIRDPSGPARLRLLQGRADVSPETRAWARSLLERDLDWLFQRYAQYLAAGTPGLRDAPRRDRTPALPRAAESRVP